MQLRRQGLIDWEKAKKVLLKNGFRSWSQVANDMGIQRQRLYCIRTGRTPDPRLSTVFSLCKVLGCRIDDILREETVEENPLPYLTESPCHYEEHTISAGGEPELA